MERTGLLTTALVALVFCGIFAGVTTAGLADQPTTEVNATDSQQSVRTAPTQTSDSRTIVATTEYRLTPSQPGRVEVHWTFDVPDDVGSLTTTPVSGAEQLQVRGFTQNNDGTYTWERASQSTETPTMTFTVAVNRTRDVTGPNDAGGRYSFVDTGDWALFQRQVPRNVGYTFRSSSEEPTIERRSVTAGSGVAGSAMVFLGQYDTTTRSAHGQTFQLVVPDAATLTEERADIFRSVTAASERLRIGDRDERVLMIAAPQEIPWAIRGLQTGEHDFYVVANESVDSADNVWIHEYVHTRQQFETTDQSAWIVEASAEYYAGLLALDQNRIDFQEFQEYLDRGTNRRWADVRLTEPTTWRPNGGNYVKGALVSGTLDRQIRSVTDGSASLQRVLEDLNRQETATHSDFLQAVTEASDTGVRDVARRYTETTATPSVWSQRTHQDVFGTVPASFSFQFPDAGANGLRISGPYGPRPYTGDGLVRAESLETAITVTNIGGKDGNYDLVVTRNGERVATRSGQLQAGANTTESVSQTFEETGQYRLSTGDDSLTVQVLDPAPLVVTDLVSTRPNPDSDTIRLTATIENRNARPATGTISISRGSTELTSEDITLTVGERTTLNATTTLDGPGTYEFRAGSAGLTLTVEQADSGGKTGDAGGTDGSDIPGTSGPGFGVGAALTAVAAALLLAHRVE